MKPKTDWQPRLPTLDLATEFYRARIYCYRSFDPPSIMTGLVIRHCPHTHTSEIEASRCAETWVKILNRP